MTIDIADSLDELKHDVKTINKHQYDDLVDGYRQAKLNNFKLFVWRGQTLILPFANYLIEYLSPRFKNMR